MSYKILFLLILFLSCNATDFEIDENLKLKQNEFQFFSVISLEPKKTNLLNKVVFNGKIEPNYRCLEEAGFFYSKQQEILYQDQATFNSLINNSEITLVEIPFDSLRGRETGFSYTYDFPLEELGKTYFIRGYAHFKNDCDSVRHERIHLEQATTPKEINLTGGWYRVPFDGDLWDRKGGIAVKMENKTILGGGCAFPSFCIASIKGYPFLTFQNSANIDAFEELSTPIDRPGGGLFNRSDGIAFSLEDTIYYGTGEIDSKVTSNFFAFTLNQNTRAREIQLPASFEPRTKAVGFSIKGKGYFGLGETENAKPDGTLISPDVLDDFWEFDPNAVSPDSQWTKLEVRIDPTSEEQRFRGRRKAVGFSVNNEYAIIGGGTQKREFLTISDYWEFRPHPDSAFVTLKYINSLKDNTGKAVKVDNGVGFEIKGEIFVGLGQSTNLFFKLQNGVWEQVQPLPDFPTDNGIGFSHNQRGYLFSGEKTDKNDGTNIIRTISNDLWGYIPEK